MAVAFDAITNGANSTNNISHTITGSNPAFLALVEGDTTDTMSGCTYNSVAMTLVDKVQTPSDRYLYAFILFNPATGAHTVTTSGSTFMQINAVSYTGIFSTTADNHTTATATSSPCSTSLTTKTNNSWIVMIGYSNNGASTAGSGFTNRGSVIDGSRVMDTNGAITPQGSTAVSFTAVGAVRLGLVAVSISPTSPSGFLTLL